MIPGIDFKISKFGFSIVMYSIDQYGVINFSLKELERNESLKELLMLLKLKAEMALKSLEELKK
jgi:hypothetical protein